MPKPLCSGQYPAIYSILFVFMHNTLHKTAYFPCNIKIILYFLHIYSILLLTTSGKDGILCPFLEVNWK